MSCETLAITITDNPRSKYPPAFQNGYVLVHTVSKLTICWFSQLRYSLLVQVAVNIVTVLRSIEVWA